MPDRAAAAVVPGMKSECRSCMLAEMSLRQRLVYLVWERYLRRAGMCRDGRDGGLGADQPVADAAGLRGSQTTKPGSEMPARWFPMPGWNGWLGVWVDGWAVMNQEHRRSWWKKRRFLGSFPR